VLLRTVVFREDILGVDGEEVGVALGPLRVSVMVVEAR
jgi:hypothetical protein